MNVYSFHALKKPSPQTKFSLVAVILQGQVSLNCDAEGTA
jgi:hypothetical protein